jgi:hypothetical protein
MKIFFKNPTFSTFGEDTKLSKNTLFSGNHFFAKASFTDSTISGFQQI